jgi:hypothetical protein
VRWALVTFVLLALAGCTTATSGHSTTTGPSSASASAPAPPCKPGVPGQRGVITSKGAPFCYGFPAGWTDNSTMTGYASDWAYRTLVSLRQFDLIEVLAARLPFDSDTYSDAQLLAYANRGRRQAGDDSEIVRASALKPLRVAGARAFEQTVTNIYHAEFRAIFVFRGRSDVYIQCEHHAEPAKVAAACAAVLSSIRIVSLR